nr:unnamed protein product [Callosobruchus chinensis]
MCLAGKRQQQHHRAFRKTSRTRGKHHKYGEGHRWIDIQRYLMYIHWTMV